MGLGSTVMRVMFAKFGGTCSRCRQRFPSGTAIEWSKATGAVHANPAGCTQALASPTAVLPVASVTVDLSPIAALLHDARGRGLKFPKARFLAPDGSSELRLSLAGQGSKSPGSLQVTVGDRWVGRVEPNGQVVGALARDKVLMELLLAIAANPAEAAKAYGALMCKCSFCSLPLTDAGSVEVGYGPVCAKKWGLPHRPQGAPRVEALAS